MLQFEITEHGYTPLMLACVSGNVKIAKIIIANVLGRGSLMLGNKKTGNERIRL